MEMKKELLAKAKNTKTPEELLCLAQENGEEMTEESAKAYFELLHPKTGKIADEELDNVAGGNCYNSGRLVVTTRFRCWDWQCKNGCAKDTVETSVFPYRRVCRNCGNVTWCEYCKYCSYERGLWLCNNPNTEYGRKL